MPTSPDPETLLRRARAHVEAGDAWRARRKLRTWLAQFPFDARLALLLGELELLAGEVPAAGRWLWLAESEASAHRAVIERFVARSSSEELWNALPPSLRRADGPELPRTVGSVLTERGVPVERRRRAAARARGARQSAFSEWLSARPPADRGWARLASLAAPRGTRPR